MQQESDPHLKAIWERCLDYELGHLELVRELFKKYERRDPAEVLPPELPEPINYASQREFVRKVLSEEVDLRARGTQIVDKSQEGRESQEYREHMNSSGSPSEIVAAGYQWSPGAELVRS